ncbi:MAG: alanine--tRNA ligase [Planctomycetota bacterium]
MKPDELREAYLSFFESKGHTRYPSDSLVPENDPTLLFTGAGMNQFKEMFLGIGNLPFSRATTSQKCFRTGDLDNVGRTYYHQTFFEMLGNFSFGDYFKKEAITWQWEFLTEVLKIPQERLTVSVYKDDDEAFDIWHKDVGVPKDRIWRLGAKDNYWPANAPENGPNGPCGPCSEVFYDFGSPGEEGDPEAGRYSEIGNLVFTQYNRVGKNELEPLAQKNIDTGMGFARILAVLNGVRSNFETELFLPIIRAIAKIADVEYTYEHEFGQQVRRIAEHTRAAVFLIAAGVKPSNEGRGYVVRRILRRAIRDGIALGIERPFLHELVDAVLDVMGVAYPEIETAAGAARAFLKAEDETFRATYHTGIALLEKELARLEASGEKTLDGKTAFVLYDSHGFPLELSEEICRERGISVDRAAFDKHMAEQRERSRERSAMKGEVFVATAITAFKRDVAPTEFVGYGQTDAESEAVVLLRADEQADRLDEGEEGRLVIKATPFYAESGGQVGDAGTIETKNGVFRVTDTKKSEGYFLHSGVMERGTISRGEKVALHVDGARRAAITRNHSVTHLLHAALRAILGTHVAQAGSMVGPDRMRFDFTHTQPVKRDELRALAEWVNAEILKNSDVETAEMPIAEAKAAGAMALFGEKYSDVVRVVTIGEHSMELCGGIHVGGSAEVGAGLITQETSVAAGVRRIEMVTGGGAVTLANAREGALLELAASLKTNVDSLAPRVTSLQQEIRELKKADQQRRRESGGEVAEQLLKSAVSVPGDSGDVKLLVAAVDGDDVPTLQALADEVRKRAGECALMLAGRGESGTALVASATDGAIRAGLRAGDMLKDLAGRLGGKGGGRPQTAQGRAPVGVDLDEALDGLRNTLQNTISGGGSSR